MRLLFRIVLAALVTAKILMGSLFIYQVKSDYLSIERSAMASELKKDAEQVMSVDEPVVEEEKIDLEFLKKKKAELEKQEEEITKKKAELLAIKEDINTKIAELTQLRNEIRAEMENKSSAQEQKLRHIIKAYSSMKPQKAASLIEKLDTSFAIEILSNMKGDIVGSILSFLDTEKAAKISEQLVAVQD